MLAANHEKEFYKEAFTRNKGLISSHLQERLKNTRIAICGMGGVGEIHAETLARLGVGCFAIADGDTFEQANINRQMEAMTSTIGKSKVDVLNATLQDINPFIQIESFGYITSENIDQFLEDVDIVVDGVDFFEFDIRRKLFNKARAKGIPVITAAPVGFGSSVIVFTKESMSFDEYFDVNDITEDEVRLLHFGVGLTPSLLQRSYFAPDTIKMKEHSAPSSVLGTLAAADWVGALVCKIVNKEVIEHAPVSFHFDPYLAKMKRTNLWFGNRNIIQRLKIWYLKKKVLHR